MQNPQQSLTGAIAPAALTPPLETRRFFHNAILIGVAEMIARGRALVVLPLITHHFGASGYGLWSQVIMLTLLLTPLVLVNSHSGIVRKLSGLDPLQQKRGFFAWILFVLATGLFFTATVYLLRDPVTTLFFPGDSAYAPLVPLAAANIVVAALPLVARTWFRLRNDAFGLAILPIGQSVLNIAGVSIGMLLGFDLYHIVLITILADLILVGGMLLTSLARAGFARPNFAILGPVLMFSLPLLPNSYAIWGLNWLDRFFVLQYRGIAEVGVYAAATSLGYVVIQTFANPIWSMYPAHVTELYGKGAITEINAVTRSTARAVYGLIIPSAFGLWVLGYRIMLLLGAPIFLKGVPVIPIVTIAYLLTSIAAYDMIALGLVHRQVHSTVALMLSLATNLVLNFLLIPPYGIPGAAIATLAAFAVQLGYVHVMARHYLPNWRGTGFPARIILAGALMAGALSMLDRWVVGPGLVGLVFLSVFGAALCLGLFIALGVFPVAELTGLARRFTGRRTASVPA